MSIDAARHVIRGGVEHRTYPGAAVEVGAVEGPIWSETFGGLTFDADASPVVLDTIYDLASLTKPIATTTVAMDLAQSGRLRLDAPIAEFFDEWRGIDREAVSVRDLLEHASGLPARLVDLPPPTRREFAHDICTIALEYPPRTRSLYSDLGFILLGLLVEEIAGAHLDALFERISSSLDFAVDDVLAFGVSANDRARAAPTEPLDADPRRGRHLVGEVHDNYAAALGGVAGHAGLFGNASGVGAFARVLLRAARGDTDVPRLFAPSVARTFLARSTVPGSSRALGWDTMLLTSSCGERMSTSAFGHVGFTGTSLWLDPDRDRYFVLLSNRVCGGGTLDDMRTVRRAFHDALGDL